MKGLKPHLAVRVKSHGFYRVAVGTWGTNSSYGGGGHSKLVFFQRRQDSWLVRKDTSGISTRLGRALRTLLEVRWETECPFLGATVILGFLTIFEKIKASSHLQTLHSESLYRCQSDVRPPVQMRRGHRAFSRDCTGDSNIPSTCEMKDEPTFKRLQGNRAVFAVRASQCTFHLRQQTQGPSHIPIAEGSLLLR